MRRRFVHDESGIALVVAMLLLAVMLTMGLAVLSVVDIQSSASSSQREGDSSFNLADTTLSSTAFVLSRNWPDAASAGKPWTMAANCGAEDIHGGVASTTDTSIAGQIQHLVAQASAARNGPSTATWSVKICDAGSAATWSSALLTAPAYDSTGKRTLTDPNGNTFFARRLWVRATSTVNGRTRSVASLVQVQDQQAFPAGYGIVTGKMAFLAGGVGTATTAILGDGTALGTLTTNVLGVTTPMVTGKIGIRCGLLSDLCPDAIAATLTEIPLLTSTALASGQVMQYGSATSTSPDTIRLLRERAVANNTYYPTMTTGSSCIPAGVTPSSTSVIFIEKIGTGTGTCTLPATAAQQTIGTIVVGSGRINVTSTAPSGVYVLTGVLYGLNGQKDTSSPVVTVNSGARIVGAVFVDGGGPVAVYPPSFSVTATVCHSLLSGLLGLLCNGPVGGLLSAILNNVTPSALLTALLPQLSSYGPVVQYDAATVGAQRVYGSSGVVQGTFRQVPSY